MKKIKFSLLLLILIFAMTTTVVAQDHHGTAEDTCTEHTDMLVVGTTADENKFNVTEKTVDKGACLMIMFENTQQIEHDLALYDEDGKEQFGLHLMTNGTKMIMYQMPDADTEMEYWCTITGHKEQGMYGVITVGEGIKGFLPGFGFASVLAGLTGVLALHTIRSKKS